MAKLLLVSFVTLSTRLGDATRLDVNYPDEFTHGGMQPGGFNNGGMPPNGGHNNGMPHGGMPNGGFTTPKPTPPRCCCPRAEPVPKYVCIDHESSDRFVFSPVSEVLNSKSFDGEFMKEPTKTKDRQMLYTTQEKGRLSHQIPVKARIVSKCNGTDAVEVIPTDAIEEVSTTMDASSFKYEGLQWANYTQKTKGYEPDGNLIVIDGIVYTESSKVLSTEGVAKCVQHETTAKLELVGGMSDWDGSHSDKSTCTESKNCQKYVNTHACGWGQRTGVLYKRVGRTDGECVSDERLRKVKEYWLFGEEEAKCPNDMYHSASSKSGQMRGKGFLFCQCSSGQCE